MNIKLSDNFSYSKLIRFITPSILMMIITSIYGVVDGLFVSNYVGKDAFTSLNIIFPFIMICSAFSFMFGTGGCALVSKYLGEKKENKANEVFSMLITILIISGVLFSTLGIVFIEPISIMLGATEKLLADCVSYGIILLICLTGFMLQVAFQPFAVAADKPQMGFILSIASGITNVIFDYLLIVVLEWGIAGAAIATGLSQVIGGIIPLIYFLSKKNDSRLKLVRFNWDIKDILISSANGLSEMMTNVSMSLINILYNLQLMKFIGENGVSAYGIIMYVSFVFSSVFIGYTIGVSPIISYHFGAKNKEELKSLLKKSLNIMFFSAVVLTILAEILAPFLAGIFVGYDEELLQLSIKALRLYSISYLISNINIFASAFFTALNNGLVSAIISFLRTLFFQAIMIMILPYIWNIDSIWLAVVFAELMCLLVTAVMFKVNQKKYDYY